MSFLVKISPEQKRLLELQYTIYTDGSCDHKNKGGWAAVIIDNKQKKTILSGFTPSSTNNRMELTAIIEALEWVLNKYDEKTKPYVKICLYSDSRYSIKRTIIKSMILQRDQIPTCLRSYHILTSSVSSTLNG
jgi:ribonuclease HI